MWFDGLCILYWGGLIVTYLGFLISGTIHRHVKFAD